MYSKFRNYPPKKLKTAITNGLLINLTLNDESWSSCQSDTYTQVDRWMSPIGNV